MGESLFSCVSTVRHPDSPAFPSTAESRPSGPIPRIGPDALARLLDPVGHPGVMRMFVALYPDASASTHLDDYLRALRPAWDETVASHIRWIPPDRWHVTLAFLAHVDPGQLDPLASALRQVAADHAPMPDLVLAGAGSFGSALWIGVEPTARGSAAERLAKATQRAVRRCGIAVDHAPWKAHLTIARVRGAPSEVRDAARKVTRRLTDYRGPAWTADHLVLVNSVTGPQPEHHRVSSLALTAAMEPITPPGESADSSSSPRRPDRARPRRPPR